GLLGGSFDPAHGGHAHVTREALKHFGLDQVWWLVSPANPLKIHGPAPIIDRIVHARKTISHPRVKITEIEQRLGTRYTAQTLKAMQQLYPSQRFVWLMGADNLAQFHLWQDWQDIARRVPLGILARPGDRISARMSRAANLFEQYRISGRNSQMLSRSSAPAWCFVNIPMMMSSFRERATAVGQRNRGRVRPACEEYSEPATSKICNRQKSFHPRPQRLE
ncbi:UNVERIFIED_CONTAM: hypothetical protein GTU68_026518, partial [Idotea baltica]|nr:hypothetical protein [Idotea baltica]